MDRQFDFRVLLVQIQNRLSDDDRRRFHFLIGDIIPRHQRDDCTLGGTLTLLESLFDRALISEDYLEFLIRVFREIQCYDAVRRLQGWDKDMNKCVFIGSPSLCRLPQHPNADQTNATIVLRHTLG